MGNNQIIHKGSINFSSNNQLSSICTARKQNNILPINNGNTKSLAARQQINNQDSLKQANNMISRGSQTRKSDHRLKRDRLQELQRRIDLGGAHQLRNPPIQETNQLTCLRPMSVLEWRKSVWGEFHRPEIDPQLIGLSPKSNDQSRPSLEDVAIKWSSTKRSAGSVEALSVSSNLEQEEEGCLNARKLFCQTPISTTLDLSEIFKAEGKRNSVSPRSIPVKPLIDLSKAIDSEGRPIDAQSRLKNRKTTDSRRIVEDTTDEQERILRLEIEQRHRAAMRKLQAEASDILEQARCEALTRNSQQNNRVLPRNNSLVKSKTLEDSSDWIRNPRRSDLKMNRSLKLPGFLIRKGSEPGLLFVSHKTTDEEKLALNVRNQDLRRNFEKEEAETKKKGNKIYHQNDVKRNQEEEEEEEEEDDSGKKIKNMGKKLNRWIKKVKEKVNPKESKSLDLMGGGSTTRILSDNKLNSSRNKRFNEHHNNFSKSILVFSKNSDQSLSQSFHTSSHRAAGYEMI
ncbi:hypothetical protein BY996DRAFT_6408567 [Phakopsora pachyrhizi]|nr:hypothetical protein BY996DRAFT_6408567 [Phakopsora pachyrhizi]